MMGRHSYATRALAATLIGAIVGCGSGGSTEPAVAGNALIASKLATVAVGVATAGEGHSFFDNFLPCPRRGMIDYRNSPLGRLATFTGCDAGDGVIIDGSAELRWTVNGTDRSRITSIEIAGPLHVRDASGTTIDITSATVGDISFATTTDPLAPPSVDRFRYSSARVTLGGETFTPTDAANPANVFHPTLTIDALGSATIDQLSDADMKRLAYHGALALAATLFNETLETQRGDHTHTLPCGTMRVTIDRNRNLPVLDMNWNACDMGGGLLVSGIFTLDWSMFDATTGVIAMRLSGSATFGGGIPRVTVTRLDWSLSGIARFPASARLTMQISDGTRQRNLTVDLMLDD
jgi:hypothetical protein